jgi:hypothetical protein
MARWNFQGRQVKGHIAPRRFPSSQLHEQGAFFSSTNLQSRWRHVHWDAGCDFLGQRNKPGSSRLWCAGHGKRHRKRSLSTRVPKLRQVKTRPMLQSLPELQKSQSWPLTGPWLVDCVVSGRASVFNGPVWSGSFKLFLLPLEGGTPPKVQTVDSPRLDCRTFGCSSGQEAIDEWRRCCDLRRLRSLA